VNLQFYSFNFFNPILSFTFFTQHLLGRITYNNKKKYLIILRVVQFVIYLKSFYLNYGFTTCKNKNILINCGFYNPQFIEKKKFNCSCITRTNEGVEKIITGTIHNDNIF